ncbi:MAG: DUF2619 domain-containing protein [Bacillota bacterium]
MEQRLMQGMVLLRGISACLEVTAVLLMLRASRLESLLRLNAVLGLVGPATFLAVSALGLAGLSGRLHPGRFLLVALGVLLVLLGTRPSS